MVVPCFGSYTKIGNYNSQKKLLPERVYSEPQKVGTWV